MMLVLGPTSTPEERRALADTAWDVGGWTLDELPVMYATDVLLLPGVDDDPVARAAVALARAVGLPVRTAPALLAA